MRRRLAVISLIAIIVAGAFAAAELIRWPGHLGSYGSEVSLPVRPGAAFSVGMGEFATARQIEIESVQLHGADRGIVLVGAVIHGGRDGMTGAERRFPPARRTVDSRPANGALVAGASHTMLLIGLAARHAGAFHVRGVDVFYRERLHGIELRRHAHFGVQVYACATTEPLRTASCHDTS